MAGHEQFLEYCRSMKPPYQCPVPACGRVYKSLAGIHTHMTTFDHNNLPATPPATSSHTSSSSRKKGQKRNASPILGQLISGDPEPPPVPFSTDMKNVEFELDGKPMKISVYDPIEILSKEEFEASLPPRLEEAPPPEAAKTPLASKPTAKSQKTPKHRSAGASAVERGCDVQRYTIEDKRTKGLPEANFTIIEDYYDKLPDAPPLTDEYYRFVEKTHQELAEEIEYDLDEEDCAWLELVNEQREAENLEPVGMYNLQLLMDRLEKESFFQAESSGRADTGVAPIDEDAVCCICMDGECQNSNVILFCDMCNLAVHQECYGVPYIPEGQWLCRRCLQSPSRAVDCALCPNKGGAFKQTDDSRWAHVVCAMWIPEVCFANTVFLEPIDSIGNIPAARWKLTCYICKQRGVGSCIQCNKANCYRAFHVTCAQQASLHMKIDAIRETSVAGTSVTVRKAAYCDMHTPHDADQAEDGEAGGAAKRAAEAKAAWRQKMKKARKILAEKRSAAPMVALPTIPPDRIQELASLAEGVSRMSQFMHRLLAFWTLKRQSRNGVPLLRRLTNAHSTRRNNALNSSVSSAGADADAQADGDAGGTEAPAEPREDSEEKAREKETEGSKKRKDPEGKAADAGAPKKKRRVAASSDGNSVPPKAPSRPASPFDNVSALVSQIKYWQTLRQDLEKARLLCELISKREREKKKMISVCCELRRVQLAPLVALQLRVIDQLLERDTNLIFAEPVDLDEVKDYSEVVSCPMDLSTMRQKAEAHQYATIDDLEKDFNLMIDNCLVYNAKDTIFYKAGLKLQDQGSIILSNARRAVSTTGFDEATGLLLPHRPKPPPLLPEATIIKRVDEYLERVGEESPQDVLELRTLLDLTNQLRHYNSRVRRRHLLKERLDKLTSSASSRDSSADGTAQQASVDQPNQQHQATEAALDASAATPPPAPAPPDAGAAEATAERPSRPGVTSRRGRAPRRASPDPPADPPSSDVTDASADPPEPAADPKSAPVEDKPPETESSGGAPVSAARPPGRGRTRGAGRRAGTAVKRSDDANQKRIDSFFTKVPTASNVSETNPSSCAEPAPSPVPPPSSVPPPPSSVPPPPSSVPPPPPSSSPPPTPAVAAAGAVDTDNTEPVVPDPNTAATPPPDPSVEASVDVAPHAASTAGSEAPHAPPTRGSGRKRGRPGKRRGAVSRLAVTKTSEKNAAAEEEKPTPDVAETPQADPCQDGSETASAAAASGAAEAPKSSGGEEVSADTAAACDAPAISLVTEDSGSSEGMVLTLAATAAVGGESSSSLGGLQTSVVGGGLLEFRETLPSATHRDAFKVYRTGGEKAPETDEDTHSESTSSLDDSDDSCSESESDAGAGAGAESESGQADGGADGRASGQEIQLEPLDLVWAKCRGYPWYPALIINPKMPRTGYFHNHVPIPVPPQEVLDLAQTCPLTHQYLVLFFDSKRTWQWLPRGKLEPLGERPDLDKAKLVESRKPADRKAVKRAYEQAILHRCRVTGDQDTLTGESEEEGAPPAHA